VGRCTGVCSGLISVSDYKRTVIKPIILFLEGKKGMVVRNMENEIKEIEKNLRLHKDDKKFLISNFKFLNNKLNFLKYQIINIRQVLENVKILGVVEKYAGDSVELAKVLGLAKEPKRIEGYDVANIFGKEAVGSMVVFSRGEADKKEYRKFKIKINNGKANDVGMIKEILNRRFNNDWILPDLIIVDGGKGQLNAVLNILKKMKLNIAVIAISKGDGLRSAGARDKIFFPGERKPLELPLASPALHLIKRVRDEAHRFAISYHRSLRKKRFIKK
jgi:excinuclease ABC subunit C